MADKFKKEEAPLQDLGAVIEFQILKARRAWLGLSLEEMKKRCGYSHGTISSVMAGSTEHSIPTVQKIAFALDLRSRFTFEPIEKDGFERIIAARSGFRYGASFSNESNCWIVTEEDPSQRRKKVAELASEHLAQLLAQVLNGQNR